MSASLPLALPALDNTFGAWFIGTIFAAVLLGCVYVQAWYYFVHYPTDRWYIKLLVACVVASETCHQALVTHWIYSYLVTYYGNPMELAKIIWSASVAVFFNGSTIFLVQCFLTLRVYRLSKRNLFLTATVFVVALCQFSMLLGLGIKTLRYDTFVALATLKTYTMAMNGMATAGDLYIALLLCILLHKSRTGFRKSDTLISRLILFSINTGLLTSFCAVASLICLASWSRTFIYMGFYMSVSRMYCCSLLVTLNVRQKLREENPSDGLSYGTGSHQMSNRSKFGTAPSRMGNNISIRVDTTQDFARDEQFSESDVKNDGVV